MKRRPAHSRRQAAVDDQNDLIAGVTCSAHAQNLASVPVLQLQEIIHIRLRFWKREDMVYRKAEKQNGDDHDADTHRVDFEALADGQQQKNCGQ